MKAEDYIMTGTNSNEAKRLQLQVDADNLVVDYISPAVIADRASKMYLNSRFLEIGPGPGHITQSIAAKHPELEITAIDINAERILMAQEQTAEFDNVIARVGDVTRLEEPSNSYRYAFIRLVLEHLKAEQQQVMNALYRVLEPGGKVIAQSVDHGLGIHFPESDYLAEIKQIMYRVLRANNYEPNTGRFLKSLVQTAGFELVEEPRVELYKLYSHPVSAKELRAYELKLEIGFPMFVQAFDSIEAAKEAQQFLLDYVKRPDTLSYTILVTVTAQKPA